MSKRDLPKMFCDEAWLILRTMPLEQTVQEIHNEDENMRDQKLDAIRHYHSCEACREKGLSAISGKHLTSCANALEIWAESAQPLHLQGVKSLKEFLALEHIFGRKTKQEDNFLACEGRVCSALFYYWKNVPLSMFYDGELECIEQLPLLIKLFLVERFSITNLLNIQKERMEYLLERLVCKDERESKLIGVEIMKNFDVLQNLIINLQFILSQNNDLKV